MGSSRPGSRGRHASPQRAAPPSIGRPSAPRHGRVLPGPLSGALIGMAAGGFALLAALPSVADPAPLVVAAAAEIPPLAAGVEAERLEQRASRAQALIPELFVAAASAAVPGLAPAPEPLPLPGCPASSTTQGLPNGRLPASVLCGLRNDSTERLRSDAAQEFTRMSASYEQAFGRPICVTDGYRTLSEQQILKRVKPGLAATPGNSEHGWGLAVDLGCGVQSFRSAQHRWMKDNAGRFGWFHPSWARAGGGQPEPWHWEFRGTS